MEPDDYCASEAGVDIALLAGSVDEVKSSVEFIDESRDGKIVFPLTAEPETPAEMRDGFLKLLWSERKSLKGTALVQGLNALVKLAELDTDKPAGPTRDVDVLDLIQTDGVLPERKRELLMAELVRSRDRMIRIDEELQALEAAE